jgi:small subunit ribosomal protein S3
MATAFTTYGTNGVKVWVFTEEILDKAKMPVNLYVEGRDARPARAGRGDRPERGDRGDRRPRPDRENREKKTNAAAEESKVS